MFCIFIVTIYLKTFSDGLSSIGTESIPAYVKCFYRVVVTWRQPTHYYYYLSYANIHAYPVVNIYSAWMMNIGLIADTHENKSNTLVTFFLEDYFKSLLLFQWM